MKTGNEEFDRQSDKIESRMSSVKNKILVMSGKGGVGKSTVAVNLACAMAATGRKTGLLDIDLHGPNVPRMLGLEKEHLCEANGEILPCPASDNLCVCSLAMLGADPHTPTIWRGPRKTAAIRQMLADVQWGELDYLFLDSPPGTGDEILGAVQAVSGWTGGVVVATPQEVALDDAKRSMAFAREVGLPLLGVIENMSGFVCPHCGKETPIFKKGGGEELARESGVAYLGGIPLEPGIAALADDGKPFCRAGAGTPAGKAFAAITEKLSALCGEKAEAAHQ
ncbi:MAG: Mrp/NBP35 family ATP-binding protein [Elusimicrobia bacterium]|nr:Mrp/NBP35 family ATP-binding protein [Elusimicrobiota bacterium]